MLEIPQNPEIDDVRIRIHEIVDDGRIANRWVAFLTGQLPEEKH